MCSGDRNKIKNILNITYILVSYDFSANLT